MTKQCSGCGRLLPATREYFYGSRNVDGLTSKCKDCARAKARAYRDAHITEVRARGRLYREVNADRINAQKRMARTNQHPLFDVWHSMVQRCHCETHRAYAKYGGRGITVCDRWRQDFSAFLHDIGPRPSSAHSLDRVDNERGYSPENCRWATRNEQQRNRSDSRIVCHDGVQKHLSEWSELVGISPQTIWRRLLAGWSTERALKEPPRVRRSNV